MTVGLPQSGIRESPAPRDGDTYLYLSRSGYKSEGSALTLLRRHSCPLPPFMQ